MKAFKNIMRIILLAILVLIFIIIYSTPILYSYKIYLYAIKDFLTLGVSVHFIGLAVIESLKEFK